MHLHSQVHAGLTKRPEEENDTCKTSRQKA